MPVRDEFSVSPSRYIGKVCETHPELKGLRRKVSYQCVKCMSEKKIRSRTDVRFRERLLGVEMSKLKHSAIARDVASGGDGTGYERFMPLRKS